jgi:hypothetical protein
VQAREALNLQGQGLPLLFYVRAAALAPASPRHTRLSKFFDETVTVDDVFGQQLLHCLQGRPALSSRGRAGRCRQAHAEALAAVLRAARAVSVWDGIIGRGSWHALLVRSQHYRHTGLPLVSLGSQGWSERPG